MCRVIALHIFFPRFLCANLADLTIRLTGCD